MLAKKYKSELISIINPLEGIYTLEFKSLGRKFKYQPGQFLHLAIDEKYDGVDQWPDSRCFSMQSNPSEDTIRITYAIKGEFTYKMEQLLNIGSEVWLKLPYGDLFSQPHSKDNTVFIAGGTGITPYLSLFTNDTFNEYLKPRIYLGFRSESYNIYKEELDEIQNPSMRIITFNEDADGVIDIRSIFNENGIESNYFISGPPMMIQNFKKDLMKNGLPEENVLTDDWE